ncbi:2-oxoglutarate carboxylase large subunit [Gammaproteobacteria bacterium]
MPRVLITDTTLRDAHQSKIATRMRTEDMLPICPKLDQVGFWSLEVWGGATFDACLRFLKEDPWERLRKLRKALPNTRLQMLLRGQNLLGYRHYSDDVVRFFVRRAADNGMDIFRIFDALNDTRNLRVSIEAVKAAGRHAQGAISYTTSPVHTVEGFVEMAKELEEMGCDSIAIKDMAGLLTPAATRELIPALAAAVRIPLALHSHATSGLSGICQFLAVERGCYHVDTAISAFADGASHPATESIVAAFSNTPWDTGLNLPLIQEIGFYFYAVRKKYRQFESEFTGLDTRVQVTQVPGGMISNLSNQLREQGAIDRMNEVLAEIPRVREDLGFPPLVTPTSQIVGTQALFNVLTGTRYKNITNEVKLYLQGKYGQAPGPVNSLVRQQAIGNEPIIECRPADLLRAEMNELRDQIEGTSLNEEDVLSYAMFPEIGRKFLEERNSGILQPEPLELPAVINTQAVISKAPVDFRISFHGETYHIKVTGTGHKTKAQRPFYVVLDGMPEEVLVEAIEEIAPSSGSVAPTANTVKGGRPKATKHGHVTTAMPGTLIDVLVHVDQEVMAGDPVLVIEAMKMETEIHAPIAGKVLAIHVAKGDSVVPDDALLEIG